MKSIRLPMTKEDAVSLRIGDVISLQGMIATGRDRMHRYLFDERPPAAHIPFDLRGSVLYHCGPIVKKTPEGYQVFAAGPTTSMRVERYAAQVIADYGMRGVMGKGGMGAKTLDALKEHGCVYLQAIGGAAVYLAERVTKVAGVWKLEEFGMAEAMWILEVNDFPAIVTMDAHGKNLHEEIEKKSRSIFETLIAPRRGIAM